MGDAADYWGDVKNHFSAESKAKRENNRRASAALLAEAGFKFTSNNDGVHLIVKHLSTTVDFWPGTGLWMVRGDARKNRGVRNLVNHLKRISDVQKPNHPTKPPAQG